MECGRTQVWLDDPNVIYRRGLATCLGSAGFHILGESSHLTPVPDLACVDILVFELDAGGLPAAISLVQGEGDVRLIGIADSSNEDLLFNAVEAGIAGFLIRDDLTPDRLIAGVQAVAHGAGSVPPRLLARLLDDLARLKKPRASRGQLVRREMEVLRLLAEGGNTREIAVALCYSERTVKNIVHDTLVKLNCSTRAQAVAVVSRQGVI
jgi:DNA-binding NarL/FixJ family response regulator